MDNKIRSTHSIFRRIGHRFGHYFDPTHFMGQDALEEKSRPPLRNGSQKSDKYFEVEVRTSGFKQDEIKVHVEGQYLHVSADTKLERLRDGFFTMELCCEAIDHSVKLPKNINLQKMKVQHDKGKVVVKFPYMALE